MCNCLENYFEIRFAELDASLNIIKELQEAEDKENAIIELKKRIERDMVEARLENALEHLKNKNIDSILTVCEAKGIPFSLASEMTSEVERNHLDILSRLDSYI